jgi:transcriptional regulator with XRE-family HTH domain
MDIRKRYLPSMPEAQMSAQQFRDLRRRAGLTQVEFARELGYHHLSISKLETGLRPIPGRLRRLVLALFGHSAGVGSRKPRSSRVKGGSR